MNRITRKIDLEDLEIITQRAEEVQDMNVMVKDVIEPLVVLKEQFKAFEKELKAEWAPFDDHRKFIKNKIEMLENVVKANVPRLVKTEKVLVSKVNGITGEVTLVEEQRKNYDDGTFIYFPSKEEVIIDTDKILADRVHPFVKEVISYEIDYDALNAAENAELLAQYASIKTTPENFGVQWSKLAKKIKDVL